MTKQIYPLVFALIAFLMIVMAGCVTPPTATTSSSTTGSTAGSSSGSASSAGETPTSTVTQPAYVTVVTPFQTSTPESQSSIRGSNVYSTPTPVPQDLSCLIYMNTQYYSYNTTAVTFDLKNPPMYINFSVKPFNITVNKVVSSKAISKSSSDDVQTYTFSDYAPYSWFEITVRNKTTGEIYLQDGFGRAKGYGTYINATLGPVLYAKDLQVELTGNNITATTGIWVKPVGNFDDPQNQTFTECKYWGEIRNTIAVATATTTVTWTPENQIKST